MQIFQKQCFFLLVLFEGEIKYYLQGWTVLCIISVKNLVTVRILPPPPRSSQGGGQKIYSELRANFAPHQIYFCIRPWLHERRDLGKKEFLFFVYEFWLAYRFARNKNGPKVTFRSVSVLVRFRVEAFQYHLRGARDWEGALLWVYTGFQAPPSTAFQLAIRARRDLGGAGAGLQGAQVIRPPFPVRP